MYSELQIAYIWIYWLYAESLWCGEDVFVNIVMNVISLG